LLWGETLREALPEGRLAPDRLLNTATKSAQRAINPVSPIETGILCLLQFFPGKNALLYPETALFPYKMSVLGGWCGFC
jgi:hypothetical protein